MKKLKLHLKRIVIMFSVALLIAVSTYAGISIAGRQVNISFNNNFVSINLGNVDPVLADLATQYAWVNGIPHQTDDTHFEWINGVPYIYMNITSSEDTYDITNDPSTKAFGSVDQSATYYAKGSAPSNPVVSGDCTFTITNTGSAAVDISMEETNPTGGVGATLVSGAPSTNEIRDTAYYVGQNPASGLVVSTSPQAFYSNLASSGTIMWDFKREIGTATDGATKTSYITLTSTAH